MNDLVKVLKVIFCSSLFLFPFFVSLLLELLCKKLESHLQFAAINS